MIELAGEQIQHEYRNNFKTQQFIQPKHAECSICTSFFANPSSTPSHTAVEQKKGNSRKFSCQLCIAGENWGVEDVCFKTMIP